MSLPAKYHSAHEYFVDAIDFLNEFKWLYNYPNTDILMNSILDEFPEDWKIYFRDFTNDDLNNLATGVLKNPSPKSLQEFFKKLIKLNPPSSNSNANPSNLKIDVAGIGVKKKHEILYLAPLVDNICKEVDVTLVVDVGSGRGYLSQTLHDLYNYKVLGIEGSSEKVDLALNFQHTNYKESKNHVKYVEHYITETSGGDVEKFVTENFYPEDNGGFCIAGLHACADLSCTILEIFLRNQKAKSLIIMPCCYHRMSLKYKENNSEYFKCFPISSCLKKIHREYDAARFLKTPFLRLACQEKADVFHNMSKEQHDIHAKNCFFRSILQNVANKDSRYTRSYTKAVEIALIIKPQISVQVRRMSQIEHVYKMHHVMFKIPLKIKTETKAKRIFTSY